MSEKENGLFGWQKAIQELSNYEPTDKYVAAIHRIKQLEQELIQVQAELAEAKKDQARYLKLIETGNFCPTQYSGLWGLHMSGEPYTKAELDAPIDKAVAAMKESK